jgi:predicted flap endonuclease-1-like 5' DNA nuclease
MYKFDDPHSGSVQTEGVSQQILPTRQSIVEMAVLFVLAVLFQWLVSSNGSTIDIGISMSAFWLPVIIMSIHYGLIEGLASAALAIAARWVLDEPTVIVGESLVAGALRIGTEPMLWIAFAVLVGGFRTRQQFSTTYANKETDTHRKRSDLLAHRFNRLQERTESLERYVATRLAAAGPEHTGVSAPDILSQSPRECISALFATFTLSLEGGSFRIYLRDGAKLAQLPMAPNRKMSSVDIIGPGNSLYEAIVTNGTAVSGDNETVPVSGDCDGVYACPIATSDHDHVVGMLLIESIHPSRLTDEYRDYYQRVCVEVGDALAKRGYSDLVERMHSDRRNDDKTSRISGSVPHPGRLAPYEVTATATTAQAKSARSARGAVEACPTLKTPTEQIGEIRVKEKTAEVPDSTRNPTPVPSAFVTIPMVRQGKMPVLLEDPIVDDVDDLQEIRGIGPKLKEVLNELGVYNFTQIAAWTPDNITWVDKRLTLWGRIDRDDWVGQARVLAKEGQMEAFDLEPTYSVASSSGDRRKKQRQSIVQTIRANGNRHERRSKQRLKLDGKTWT